MRFGIRDSACGIYSALIAMLFLSAFFVNAQEEGMEISGFRVPENDEQGQMTAQLFGDHAVLGSEGLVKIEGVRVELYREGEVVMEVESPRCFYNQKSREVNSDAAVSAKAEGIVLTGTGYLLDVEARTVHVMADSRVVFAEGVQRSELGLEPGGGNKSTNEPVITSKELFLDYNGRSARFVDSVHISDRELDMQSGKLDVFFSGENEIERALAESGVILSISEWKVAADRGTLMVLERKALLEGGVQVDSKELNMTCSTLNLSFDENNEINWIEARDEIRILNEGREAYAGKAVYDVKTDEFLLEENPKLVDGKSMLMGDRIRFWRTTGRMVCEPARAVIFPGTKFETELFEK